MKKQPKTLDKFLQELSDKDMSVADWARANGFSQWMVYQVTQGRVAGYRGKGRAIMRAMGVSVPTRQVARAETGAV